MIFSGLTNGQQYTVFLVGTTDDRTYMAVPSTVYAFNVTTGSTTVKSAGAGRLSSPIGLIALIISVVLFIYV